MDDSQGTGSERMDVERKAKKSTFTHFKLHTMKDIENINNNSF